MAHSALRLLANRLRQAASATSTSPIVAACTQVSLGDIGRRLLADDKSSIQNVPAGHKGSDLSDSKCNISLQRMRDLTLRQDLKLTGGSGPVSLKDVFMGHRALLVGLPGGKICAEQHLPEYVQNLDELRARDLDKVICIIPGDCKLLKTKRDECKENSKVSFFEDPGDGFARMLGMDRGGEGPPTQRYAGIVENGILLKLCVENHPREVDVSSFSSIMKMWEYLSNKEK